MLQHTPAGYRIGTFDPTELVKKYGSPLYVYDGNRIEDQISKMKKAFTGLEIKLKYACKALTNINILKIVKKNGVGIDAVSIEEVYIALRAGFDASEIQYTPSGAPFIEVDEAISKGVNLNIDSLALLEHIGSKYGSTIKVAVRLNPSIMAGGNLKISTGHADSKFGIPIEYIDQVVEIVKKYNINVIGLHQHNGSDFKDANVIVEAMQKSFDVALKYFPKLEFIDMGSGFKVPYSENDILTNLDAIGKDVVASFNKFKEEYGYPIQLWFEPGKYLVSEAGTLLTTVTVVKHNPSRNFIHVDSGLNHLLRPMMYDAYHHIINITSKSTITDTYDVVGYICETDTLGASRTLPETKSGDLIAIQNAGAYAISMASNYNSRRLPAEVLIYNGEDYLIRKRQSIDEVFANQIEVEL